MFQESNMATLELKLPSDLRKDLTTNHIQMRLDVLVQELVNRIRGEHGLKYIKLILRGKTLSAGQRLDEQGVKNNSKIMVMRVTDPKLIEQLQKEEEERTEKEKNQEEKKEQQDRSFQRTRKGFQILSKRDGSEDHFPMPYLEIADQKGNPLQIPHRERKALILAMGYNEKGRSLMKRKQYENALCHLLEADQQFRKFDSTLLTSVDNYAVLQLDIVWCYKALEALSYLEDAKSRLQKAEDCFLRCYGEQQARLQMIKGNTGREQVLFLRLYLLQSLLFYYEGNAAQAQDKLSKVESLYGRLCPDSEKMTQLMARGFSASEARLGLRACQGDLNQAEIHINNCRQEQEELKQRERQKRRGRMENMAASHRTDRDVNRDHGFLYSPFERDVPPPFTSYNSTEDDKLVNEVLVDISQHEEDYLDLTLEEESQLINTMKTYLN
ncbi:NEDD8 ultimate buster 1-like [Channa argus]|uniref:NEDD8 ultimate buster 1-like n=1 Tax=Channa argus TaxID=215402 RepID=UPI0035211D70